MCDGVVVVVAMVMMGHDVIAVLVDFMARPYDDVIIMVVTVVFLLWTLWWLLMMW